MTAVARMGAGQLNKLNELLNCDISAQRRTKSLVKGW
jgi:hypothetical protein